MAGNLPLFLWWKVSYCLYFRLGIITTYLAYKPNISALKFLLNPTDAAVIFLVIYCVCCSSCCHDHMAINYLLSKCCQIPTRVFMVGFMKNTEIWDFTKLTPVRYSPMQLRVKRTKILVFALDGGVCVYIYILKA